MLRRYGDKAEEQSAARVDDLTTEGDHDGAATWRRIADAVRREGRGLAVDLLRQRSCARSRHRPRIDHRKAAVLEIPNIARDDTGGFCASNRRNHQIRGATWAAEAAPRGEEIAIGDRGLAIERQHALGEIILKHGARRRFEARAAAAIFFTYAPGAREKPANPPVLRGWRFR